MKCDHKSIFVPSMKTKRKREQEIENIFDCEDPHIKKKIVGNEQIKTEKYLK